MSAKADPAFGRVRLYAGLTVVLLVSIYMLAGTIQYYRYVPGSERGDWRAMGALLQQMTKDAEPVVFATRKDHEAWFASASAMCLSHYAHSDRPIVVLEAPATEEVLRELRKYPRILFISRFVSAARYLPGFEMVEQQPGTLCPIQALRPI